LRYATNGGNATQNGNTSGASTKDIVKKIGDQIVKRHLDIIVLKALKSESLSGYGVIALVHRDYGVLLGSGMVYYHLHSLEKKHLITAKSKKRAKYYTLTEKGEEFLKIINDNSPVLRRMADNLF
jgi:DNA-binding PadR family transcriptional regulator